MRVSGRVLGNRGRKIRQNRGFKGLKNIGRGSLWGINHGERIV